VSKAAVWLAAAAVPLFGCASPAPNHPRHQVERELTLPGGETVRYLLYMPATEERDAPLPMILFLHGAEERGDDLDLVRREGLPRLLDSLERFPFIVVSPQNRTKHWNAAMLPPFLEEARRLHSADPDRVCATGLSTGAVAALKLAIARPDLLSSVVAVTPDSVPKDLCRLDDVPVWLFQNARDIRVPPRWAKKIAREIEACGGSAKLTLFPRDGHDAWSEAYVYPGLYDWIRAQRRGAAGMEPAGRSRISRTS
jgi:predicted peptidase